MPEYPEVETVRRVLEASATDRAIDRVHPVHLATLKTIDPPVATLEGHTFGAVDRRGKHLLLRTADGELVLHVHQMTAGRISVLEEAARRPKTAALRLDLAGGRSLVMTERGSRKQARVGLYTPEAIAAELAHLGPEAHDIETAVLAEQLQAENRRLHAFLRDQRAIAGIGRAWANEILLRARLSPYALTTELADAEVSRLSETIRETLAEGLELRLGGANDAKAYRIHKKLGEPCPQCGTPIAQVDFEQHTIFYCPSCQTGGRLLKDRRLSKLLR